jgi:hypothetical protein
MITLRFDSDFSISHCHKPVNRATSKKLGGSIYMLLVQTWSRGSSVGIATGYGLDSRGSIPGRG